MSAEILIEEYREELAAPKTGRFLVKMRRHVRKPDPPLQKQMSREHMRIFGKTMKQMRSAGAKNMNDYVNKEIRQTVASLKRTAWGSAQNQALARLNALVKFRQMIPKFNRYKKVSVKYAQQLKKSSKSPEIPKLKHTRDTLHKELIVAARKPFRTSSMPEVLAWKAPGASGKFVFLPA